MGNRTVQNFATCRDAKEFLVGRIVTEAQRTHVAMSEVERKMLYFSETGWTLPDIADVNGTFDRDYDQAEYVQKIVALIRNLCAAARPDNRDEIDTWNEAVGTLGREDHYLLVLIAAAEGSLRPGGSVLKLLAFALAVICVIVALIFLATRRY